MGLGGRQDEDRVGRRLFKRLQQGIEGLGRQHVDLVDDVHPRLTYRRCKTHPLAQVPHLIDATMRRSVNLNHIR